jgi:hypothetical protein
MEKRSEVLSKFKHWMNYALANFSTETYRVKHLVVDYGAEYFGGELNEYCSNMGIIVSPGAAYNPQQNGVAERMNRTLCANTRAMLIQAKLPASFWPYALINYMYIRNRVPSTACLHDSHIPYTAWYGHLPDIMFECLELARMSLFNAKKEPRKLVSNPGSA